MPDERDEYIKNLEVINEGLRQSFEELTTIYRLVEIITGAKTLERVLNSLLDLTEEIIQYEGAMLFLVDEKTNELDISIKRNISKKIESKMNLQSKKKVIEWLLKEGRPIAMSFDDEMQESDSQENPPQSVKQAGEDDRYTYVLVPLIAHDKPVGILDLMTTTPEGDIRNKDLSLLSVLAKQAALAIENVRLYESMKKDQINIIRALASTVDAKDHYTLGHSLKVSEYATKICEEMALPDRDAEVIQYAALLHDIGKIAIPDIIVKKPGKLTEEEYLEMKSHPMVGAKIIKEIEALAPMVPIILHHHERFDGKGYPNGLAGEQIPLGARIVLVADAFDTMISARAYRNMMPPELAISELRKNAGTQFDPKVVDAFIMKMKKTGM